MREPSRISASLAKEILSNLPTKGQDRELLFAKFGVSLDRDDHDIVWPLARFTAVLESASFDHRDAFFGMSLGKAFKMRGLGPLASIMLASPSGADALDKLTRYFPSLQNNTIWGFSISDGIARLSYLITDASIKHRRQDAEFTIAMEQSIVSEFLGVDVRPVAVDFQHLPDCDASADAYRATFQCDVRFGRKENAIYFPAACLDAMSRPMNPENSLQKEDDLLAPILATNRHLALSVAVEAWMTSAISEGQSLDVEYAASDFGMSVRSFQRKLSQNNVSYLDLRNEVVTKIGRRLLATTPMAVTSIAMYLGYSETSAFSRNFRKTVGVSPSRFRSRPL